MFWECYYNYIYNLVVYMYGDIYVFNSYFEYLNNDY